MQAESLDDFRIHKNLPAEPSANLREQTIGYTVGGEEVLASSPKSFAKLVKRGSEYVYYVKIGRSGIVNGHLYNPYDSMFRPSQEDAVDAATGKPFWEYKRVNKAMFDAYLGFLKTRNQARLREAERGLIDL